MATFIPNVLKLLLQKWMGFLPYGQKVMNDIGATTYTVKALQPGLQDVMCDVLYCLSLWWPEYKVWNLSTVQGRSAAARPLDARPGEVGPPAVEIPQIVWLHCPEALSPIQAKDGEERFEGMFISLERSSRWQRVLFVGVWHLGTVRVVKVAAGEDIVTLSESDNGNSHLIRLGMRAMWRAELESQGDQGESEADPKGDVSGDEGGHGSLLEVGEGRRAHAGVLQEAIRGSSGKAEAVPRGEVIDFHSLRRDG